MRVLLMMLAMMSVARASIDADAFPLQISGQRLIDSRGRPFLIQGDTPWSLEVQCTEAQVDQYLDDRAARQFNAILLEAFEHQHSSQNPAWENANGDIPFVTMDANSVSWTSRVEAYWELVDYIRDGCFTRGIVMIINPAYVGSNGSRWQNAIDNASEADLYAYGQFFGARYNRGNEIICMGGDFAGTTTQRDKQWKIAEGILDQNPSVIICGHPARNDGDGATYWGEDGQDYPGFTLNTIYTAETNVVPEAASAYARGMPILGIEFRYEGEPVGSEISTNDCGYQAIQAYLSGACGFMFGNNPLWHMGASADGGSGAQDALDNNLNTAGARCMTHVGNLLRARAWHMLEPATDDSVVTTALGSGIAATCPALTSD